MIDTSEGIRLTSEVPPQLLSALKKQRDGDVRLTGQELSALRKYEKAMRKKWGGSIDWQDECFKERAIILRAQRLALEKGPLTWSPEPAAADSLLTPLELVDRIKSDCRGLAHELICSGFDSAAIGVLEIIGTLETGAAPNIRDAALAVTPGEEAASGAA